MYVQQIIHMISPKMDKYVRVLRHTRSTEDETFSRKVGSEDPHELEDRRRWNQNLNHKKLTLILLKEKENRSAQNYTRQSVLSMTHHNFLQLKNTV